MAHNRPSIKCDFINGNFWQAESYNERAYLKYLQWICKLAINRFRWEGLPDSCDVRVLETTLLTNGVAAICTPNDDDLPIWFSLPCAIQGGLNIYGMPTSWQCVGLNGDTFRSDWERGTLVYNSKARLGVWNAITLNARKLAHYDRTEDINLSVQKTPWLMTAPDTHKRDLVNLLNQVAVGEIAVLGNDQLLEGMNIEAINLDIPFKGAELGAAKRVLWSEILTFLGIPSLPYEKGERLISSEVESGECHTNIMLLDALDARREAAEYLNRQFGLDVHVYFNRDYESFNYNYLHDLERQGELQDDLAPKEGE